jgi:hypothetical protein
MAELVGYHKFYSLRIESFVGSNKISFKMKGDSILQGKWLLECSQRVC